MASRRIVIGLDFGTTYSGVAWAPVGSYISTVSGWPSRLGAGDDKQKVPSWLTYRQDGQPPCWGYSIPAETTPLKCFKLLLLDDQDLPQHVRESNFIRDARMQLVRSNRHAVEVISDYIRELWRHSLEDIEKTLGTLRVSTSPFEVVVTVPAIWPAYARARMGEAVRLAGLLDERRAGETTLNFVAEPEAAALATMSDFEDRVELKKNDHFVVCDAGGGTVDIITYKVLKEKPLRVRESVKGDGKLCGAVFLDHDFQRLLKKKIPRDIWDRLGVSDMQCIMNLYWENGIKVNFRRGAPYGGDEGLQIQLPFGGGPENRFHPPQVRFDQKEISNIFEPILAEVAELVCNQIREVNTTYKKPPKFVILVGGFGKSHVLRDALHEATMAISPKTDILQASGERPWTAVCRGAVYKGIATCDPSPFSMVDARVARASYGTSYNALPWDANEHDARDREWCPIQREFLAADQTKWFIVRGDTLWTDNPVSHTFFQDFDKPQESLETEMIYSMAECPPRRCDSSVKHLCTIRWSKVPDFSSLPVWTNNMGKKYRQVIYEVRMVPDGSSLDFHVFYDEKLVASKNVNVDFTNSGAPFDPKQSRACSKY